jgi:hypothetical protein
VGNACPALSPAGYDEVDARVLLLLRGEGGEQTLPAVVCGADGSWVAWHDQRFPITGRTALVDEIVDIVEAELHEAERRAEADPKTAEAKAVQAGETVLAGDASTPPPALGRRADPLALRAADARGGGISVGFDTEVSLQDKHADSVGGPVFDFAAALGPLFVGGHEAFRFPFGSDPIAFMDFETEVGYGAPFNPHLPLGLVARFGAEWLVAYPSGSSGQAAATPVLELGIRAARAFGQMSLWFGIDGRYRTNRITLRGSTLAASDVGGGLSIGIAFIDWSRK